MTTRKFVAGLLTLAAVGSLGAPVGASYVEESIRAVAAQPPIAAQERTREDLSSTSCWRDPDGVLVDPANGLRACEAAAMLQHREGAIRWGGPPPSWSFGPARGDLSPEACWRELRDVLVDPASGLRRCEQ